VEYFFAFAKSTDGSHKSQLIKPMSSAGGKELTAGRSTAGIIILSFVLDLADKDESWDESSRRPACRMRLMPLH
jgi:hypothetical protein